MTKSPSGALHYGLWVVQILLALAFVMAGLTKLSTAPSELVANGMTWAERVPSWLVSVIGLSELLGGLGMFLPSALRIQPALSGWAGVGLLTVMVLAAGEHALAGEFGAIVVNVVLGAMAAFVAWGRLGAAPIPAR